jgi:hypothetical protein
MVGKSRNRRRTAKLFLNIPWLLRLFINVNRKKNLGDVSCHVFAASHWAADSPSLQVADWGY